ncbi:hypothetical protein Bbelb_308560 [Branchiostoma belcheri]|nr:hypothetical protein Bbelb_308560 [Branchiostoma belcheri]
MATTTEAGVTRDADEGASWSEVVRRGTTKETVLPVFIMERDILTKEEAYAKPIKEDEMYHCLIQCVPPSHLRSVQRVRALWRIYLHNNASRAKLLIQGINIRKKSVECRDTNPFSLKSKMAYQNNTQVTVKDIPESADDSIILQYLSKMGCKTSGPVIRRKIRYNHRLTNCSNGDRVIYIEQKPDKAIPRNVKIASHWARIFYEGQSVQDRSEKTVNNEKGTEDIPISDSSPKTQANMDYIDRAFNEHVGEEGSQNDTGENNTEHTQNEVEENDGNELLNEENVTTEEPTTTCIPAKRRTGEAEAPDSRHDTDAEEDTQDTRSCDDHPTRGVDIDAVT